MLSNLLVVTQLLDGDLSSHAQPPHPPTRSESELELLWAFSVLVAKETCLHETFCADDKRPAGALVDWPPHLRKCSICPVMLQRCLGLLKTLRSDRSPSCRCVHRFYNLEFATNSH